jgi:hypothetical protein
MGGLTVRLYINHRKPQPTMTTTESEPRTFNPDLLAAAKNCGATTRSAGASSWLSTLSYPI